MYYHDRSDPTVHFQRAFDWRWLCADRRRANDDFRDHERAHFIRPAFMQNHAHFLDVTNSADATADAAPDPAADATAA